MGKKNKKTPIQNNNLPEQITQNITNSNNIVTIQNHLICISEAEYNAINNERSRLKTENEKLNKEIYTLRKDMIVYCENERLLKETINHNEQTIEELREENKKLKLEIEQLKIELKTHKNKMETQDNLIQQLTIRINDKENAELFKKYIIAIQDINRDEKLETKLNPTSTQNLIKLKTNRISDCHYLDNNYTTTEKNERRTFFLDKVQNIPTAIKAKFDKMYPKLLEDIKIYIAPQPINLTQQQIDEINIWWE